MTFAQSTLPTLFGRLTAILNEHRVAVIALHRLELECSRLGSEAELSHNPRALELVKRWHDELAAQFAAEESDAYFATIVHDRPLLSRQIEALKREHSQILSDLGGLLARGEVSRPAEFKLNVLAVAHSLRGHEEAERALLHAFLLSDDAATPHDD